ncbi:MAG: hypothetical protein DHS20C17_30990 [Cyclobacteriaceae bacterium]|nr:MAG: hypothetical protein DHS20C17_30990 [Cyclobacteriaceae bacterium]
MKKHLTYFLVLAILVLINSCSTTDEAPLPDQPPAPLPDFSSAVFTNSTSITNQYYGPGADQIYVYQGGEVGTAPEEEIVIERRQQTRQVMGITCIIHHDIVTLDGVVIEDTDDWLAQDDAGNLWYMGEFVENYHDDGTFADNDGSWEAGVDDALPGYWMAANPQTGESYMQEYLKDEAEDYAEVVGFESVTIALGTYNNCLVTKDINPFEAGVHELKYYAPGIGFIKEEKFENEELVEVVELVEIIDN